MGYWKCSRLSEAGTRRGLLCDRGREAMDDDGVVSGRVAEASLHSTSWG